MPTLHLLCGKIASGKSTLAQALAGEHDFAATDDEFALVTRHFCAPSAAQELVIEVHQS